MIDVKVSNEKLYWRAVNILRKFSSKSLSECEDKLLNSIYGRVYLKESESCAELISKHIEKATEMNVVVPKALIMLLTGCDCDQAARLLNESGNSVRNCIKKVKESA